MKKHKVCVFLMSLCLLVTIVPGGSAAEITNKKEIIQHARDSYYNLREHGLVEYQAVIKPNWELVLADQLKSDPEGAQRGLKLLNGLHFSMSVDSRNKLKVDHQTDNPPPNEQVAAGFNQIYSGLDQAVGGFFDTWSLFMLGSPFPGVESEYQVQDLGNQYRLSYKEGDADIVTTMTKSLVILEMQVTSSTFKSSIRPQLMATATGFVLSGYQGDYTPTSGPGVVHLNINIRSQEVEGLQLPQTLVVDASVDGSPTNMELKFSDYQVKKK